MPVRADQPLSRPRTAPTSPTAVLAAARALVDVPGAGSAAQHALATSRGLLAAHGVGLADVSGHVTWSGVPAPETEVSRLVRKVLHSETRRGRPPLSAVPLHVHGELAHVLVVFGDAQHATIREVAALLTLGLERGELEGSRENAAHAELRALRAEISPHFVYNALTVIAALVREHPDRAHELMLDFADYARYTFAQNNEYTTVAEEFHAIETYLALQRAVLGERIRVRIRVAPEILAVALPCLILEPLVENAIRHGVEPRAEAGTIEVRGEADGEDCVISVEDDGAGMSPEHAADLLAGESASGRLGLANVDRRLRKVYGSWYGLVLETAIGAGTRAVVRLPRFQPGVLP